MEDEYWTEHDIRHDLRERSDYRRHQDPEKVIRRAHEDILDREPDPGGMVGFKIKVLNDHWNEQDVARELRKSQEYRDKNR